MSSGNELAFWIKLEKAFILEERVDFTFGRIKLKVLGQGKDSQYVYLRVAEKFDFDENSSLFKASATDQFRFSFGSIMNHDILAEFTIDVVSLLKYETYVAELVSKSKVVMVTLQVNVKKKVNHDTFFIFSKEGKNLPPVNDGTCCPYVSFRVRERNDKWKSPTAPASIDPLWDKQKIYIKNASPKEILDISCKDKCVGVIGICSISFGELRELLDKKETGNSGKFKWLSFAVPDMLKFKLQKKGIGLNAENFEISFKFGFDNEELMHKRKQKENQSNLVYAMKTVYKGYNLMYKYTGFGIIDMWSVFRQVQGGISKDKFSEIIRDKFNIPDFPVDLFFLIFDRKKTGKLDSSDIISGMIMFTSGTPEEKIKGIFQIFDSNKDNLLSQEDLYEFMKIAFVSAAQVINVLERVKDEGPEKLKEMTKSKSKKNVKNLIEEKDKEENTKVEPERPKEAIKSKKSNQIVKATNQSEKEDIHASKEQEPKWRTWETLLIDGDKQPKKAKPTESVPQLENKTVTFETTSSHKEIENDIKLHLHGELPSEIDIKLYQIKKMELKLKKMREETANLMKTSAENILNDFDLDGIEDFGSRRVSEDVLKNLKEDLSRIPSNDFDAITKFCLCEGYMDNPEPKGLKKLSFSLSGGWENLKGGKKIVDAVFNQIVSKVKKEGLEDGKLTLVMNAMKQLVEMITSQNLFQELLSIDTVQYFMSSVGATPSSPRSPEVPKSPRTISHSTPSLPPLPPSGHLPPLPPKTSLPPTSSDTSIPSLPPRRIPSKDSSTSVPHHRKVQSLSLSPSHSTPHSKPPLRSPSSTDSLVSPKVRHTPRSPSSRSKTNTPSPSHPGTDQARVEKITSPRMKRSHKDPLKNRKSETRVGSSAVVKYSNALKNPLDMISESAIFKIFGKLISLIIETGLEQTDGISEEVITIFNTFKDNIKNEDVSVFMALSSLIEQLGRHINDNPKVGNVVLKLKLLQEKLVPYVHQPQLMILKLKELKEDQVFSSYVVMMKEMFKNENVGIFNLLKEVIGGELEVQMEKKLRKVKKLIDMINNEEIQDYASSKLVNTLSDLLETFQGEDLNIQFNNIPLKQLKLTIGQMKSHIEGEGMEKFKNLLSTMNIEKMEDILAAATKTSAVLVEKWKNSRIKTEGQTFLREMMEQFVGKTWEHLDTQIFTIGMLEKVAFKLIDIVKEKTINKIDKELLLSTLLQVIVETKEKPKLESIPKETQKQQTDPQQQSQPQQAQTQQSQTAQQPSLPPLPPKPMSEQDKQREKLEQTLLLAEKWSSNPDEVIVKLKSLPGEIVTSLITPDFLIRAMTKKSKPEAPEEENKVPQETTGLEVKNKDSGFVEFMKNQTEKIGKLTKILINDSNENDKIEQIAMVLVSGSRFEKVLKIVRQLNSDLYEKLLTIQNITEVIQVISEIDDPDVQKFCKIYKTAETLVKMSGDFIEKRDFSILLDMISEVDYDEEMMRIVQGFKLGKSILSKMELFGLDSSKNEKISKLLKNVEYFSAITGNMKIEQELGKRLEKKRKSSVDLLAGTSLRPDDRTLQRSKSYHSTVPSSTLTARQPPKPKETKPELKRSSSTGNTTAKIIRSSTNPTTKTKEEQQTRITALRSVASATSVSENLKLNQKTPNPRVPRKIRSSLPSNLNKIEEKELATPPPSPNLSPGEGGTRVVKKTSTPVSPRSPSRTPRSIEKATQLRDLRDRNRNKRGGSLSINVSPTQNVENRRGGSLDNNRNTTQDKEKKEKEKEKEEEKERKEKKEKEKKEKEEKEKKEKEEKKKDKEKEKKDKEEKEEKEDKDKKRTGDQFLAIFNDDVVKYLANLSWTRADKLRNGFLPLEEFACWVYSEPLVYPLFGIEDGQLFDPLLFTEDAQKKKKQKDSSQPSKPIVTWPNLINLYRMYSGFSDGTGINKRLFLWGIEHLKIEKEIPVDTIFQIFDKNETGYLTLQQVLYALIAVFLVNADDMLGENLLSIINKLEGH